MTSTLFFRFFKVRLDFRDPEIAQIFREIYEALPEDAAGSFVAQKSDVNELGVYIYINETTTGDKIQSFYDFLLTHEQSYKLSYDIVA